MKRFILIYAAVMMVSGCGLYKKYERPSVAFVDSLYRRMDIAPGDTVSTAALSWEQMFTDPVLQEWIRLGLEHNTDMNVARLKVEESQAYLLAARRALFPQVGFSASGGTDDGNFFTLVDVLADSVQYREVAEFFDQAAHLNQWGILICVVHFLRASFPSA